MTPRSHHRFLSILFVALFILSPSLMAEAPGADKFAAGKRVTFSTAGLDHAHGVNLTISFPDTWEATGGDDANLVTSYTSLRGFGTDIIQLRIQPLPLPAGTVPAPADIPKYFTPQALKTMVPPGAKLLAARSALVAGRQGGIYEYTTTMARGPKTMDIQVQTYAFIQGSAMVQVQCQVGAVPGGGATPLAKRMAECKPLFDKIVAAITFPPARK